MRVVVIGAGVSGLSCGIELLRAGYEVAIWARELPPETTSNQAAAIWYPYLCYPREKAIPWARASFEVFEREMLLDAASGCYERVVVEYFDREMPEPWWKDALPREVERPGADELPPGYVDGYRFMGIVMDTSIYMDYLVRRFQELNGVIERRAVGSLSEAVGESGLAVNCAGLGARELCDDEALYPVRGQMLRVRAKEIEEVRVDDEGPNALGLLVPRRGDLMLGGTAQENDRNIEVDPADSAGILERARALWPELGEVEVLEEVVGLRPVRSAVRLEAERVGDGWVVHNYGHGGAGFTLSWGCAREVVGLVGAHG